MKKILLTGGGTGGHVYPALSLVPKLIDRYEVHYMGSNGIERAILASYPYIPYHEITAVKLQRKLTLKNLLLPFKLIRSIYSAKKLLKKIKPDIVFSKGGYVAVPVVIAARWLGIAVVGHESDLTFGLANKIILKFANGMCTNFLETAKRTKKGVYTGAPIREQIFKGDSSKVKRAAGFISAKPVLLVLGGSLGAIKINKAIEASIDNLLENFNIVHLTGKGNGTEINKKGYYQIEFVNNIEDYYAFADYVLSRAGAGVIFELLALKKPTLLIPLSKECSRGDQIQNAKKFMEMGYADVLFEEELSPKKLTLKLAMLVKNKDKIINNMKKQNCGNGIDKIIEVIDKVIKN